MDINPQIVYSNRLFQNTLPGDIKLNIQSQNFLEVNEGDIIYKANDDSDSLYLLINGQVKIKFYGNFRDSSIIKRFDNDFFGENEIFEKIPRKSTAMAVDESLLYVLREKELEELIKNETIHKNLSKAFYAGNTETQKNFNEHHISNKPDIKEYNNNEPSKEVNDYSQNNSIIPDDINGNNDESEFSIDKENLSDAIIKNYGALQSIRPGEPEPLFDSREAQNKTENRDDSIIGRIKEEIENRVIESTDKDEAEIGGLEQGTDFIHMISDHNQTNEEEQIQNENIPSEISTVDSKTRVHEDHLKYPSNEIRDLNLTITESLINEISDPVELIIKYAQLLMQKSSSVEANNVLQKIVDQSKYIITSLTTYADYLNENLELKSQILETSVVLDDILYLLAGYTESRKIKLYRKIEADASIYVDKNLLYQVCLHIVKFLCADIKHEGSIFVSVNRTKDIISLEFRSTGEKITDEQLKAIFEPFAINNSPKLGFAQKIIHEHNGNITVKNSNISGPEIILQLPIVK